MGFDASWQLQGFIRSGFSGIYPRGYASEKRPCPVCQKPVAGREEGMCSHIRSIHKHKRDEAMHLIRESGVTWSTEEEIRNANKSAA